MNRFTLSLAALLLPAVCMAQLPYTVTVLSQPYAPLEEATALSPEQYDDDQGWDDPSFSAPLGFDFSFSGYVVDAMDQVGLGALMMGTTIGGNILLHGVMPTNYDLADRAINGGDPSIIRWQTEGVPGEQVFTIEWANAGMYDEVFDSSGSSLSYVNLQVRLFEADNSIDYHYGPSDIAAEITNFEPQISGLLLELDLFSYSGTVLALGGDPLDPDLEQLANVDNWYYGPYMNSYPADGTVYRFGPTGVNLDLDEAASAAFTVSPNPTADYLNVQFSGAREWKVMDTAGRTILAGQGQDGVRVDMTGLQAGTYLVALAGAPIQKVVRQ